MTDEYIDSLATLYSSEDFVKQGIYHQGEIAKLTFPQGVIDDYAPTENCEVNDKSNLTVEKQISKYVRGAILTKMSTQNGLDKNLKLESVNPSIETVVRRFLTIASMTWGGRHLVDC